MPRPSEQIDQTITQADLFGGHDMITDIAAFHEKFDLPALPTPGFLPEEYHAFRAKFLQEELDEFNEAYAEKNLEKAFDALLDLMYVALGTAYLMKLPTRLGWVEVQEANMDKVKATDASESKRGFANDVVKPAGWVAPNHTPLLEATTRFLETQNFLNSNNQDTGEAA